MNSPELVAPAFYRTARKPWNCYACARIIYPRERYVEYFDSMYKTYQSGTRFCLEHGIERCQVIDGTMPDPMTGGRVKF